jgi:predicted short-subunit dehydrogenase-like oxidoreductase (DUF2520 family)
MKKRTLNIVGAGSVGKTIGRLLVEKDLVQVLGVCNTNIRHAQTAVQFIGQGQPITEITALPSADITLITTPDDQICETSIALSKSGKIQPKNIFIHCSGVLTSDMVASVKTKDGLVASVHPMKSFGEPQIAITNYLGTFCAMEGDAEALTVIEPLFKAIGSITYPIDKAKKSTYHIAGVFASNYLVTLSQEAVNCLVESGVEEKMALQIVIHLMQGTLTNLSQTMSPAAALTGPIKRGDISTLRAHMAALKDSKRELLYVTLANATLALIAHDGNFPLVVPAQAGIHP